MGNAKPLQRAYDYIIEDEELMSIFIPTIRADFSISET
jgi:surfactin synthase thioesterase subunit